MPFFFLSVILAVQPEDIALFPDSATTTLILKNMDAAIAGLDDRSEAFKVSKVRDGWYFLSIAQAWDSTSRGQGSLPDPPRSHSAWETWAWLQKVRMAIGPANYRMGQMPVPLAKIKQHPEKLRAEKN